MLEQKIERTIHLSLNLSIQAGAMNINRVIKEVEIAAREAGCRILKEILHYLEQLAVERVILPYPGRYRHKGTKMRTIKTSLGKIEIPLLRYKDKQAGSSIYPLKEFINMPAYLRYLPWSMQDTVGLLPHLSFRGSSRELFRLKGDSPSKSTIHRRLNESLDPEALFQLDFHKTPYRFLLADGTGIRIQEKDEKTGKKSKYGELRWAYASLGVGHPFDLVGMWVNKSWEDCRNDLYSRMDTTKLELLVSDQEQGLSEAFLLPHMRHQPCLWHAKRDLSIMMYLDGFKKAQQDKIKPFYEDIALIQPLGQAELMELFCTDKPELEKMFKKTKKQISQLISLLSALDLSKTKTYVENLAYKFLTFLEIMIEKEEFIPVWSSMIEGKFSLIKNRIRNIGKRWSDEGLLRWLAVAMRKILPQFNWNKLWENILGPRNFELEVAACWID